MPVQAVAHCPECGASRQDGLTCRDHFDQMLAWEFADAQGAGAYHHLTVLCYNLQHPKAYSPQGLHGALQLLVEFVMDGAAPEQVRRQNRQRVDSGTRDYRIAGTPDAHGVYAHPVVWTTTVGAVVAGGLPGYGARVQAWAQAVYADLVRSGNLPGGCQSSLSRAG